MSVRYLFNTSGQYVAFVASGNVFNPDCDWLGFIANGNEMYDVSGNFSGYILDDDRVAKKVAEYKSSIWPPFSPFKPFKPFNPFPRLRMAPLPYGYIDVFESQDSRTSSFWEDSKSAGGKDFSNLLNTYLYGGDGVFLGAVNKNRFDKNSLTNEFGDYGSRYSSSSIFNPYGNYGSEYGSMSPYNQYSNTPPMFQDAAGRFLGFLSVNRFLDNRINTPDFVSWVKT